MKQLDVAIVTDDIPYAEALMRGLRYRSRSFRVTIHSIGGFTDQWKRGGLEHRRRFDLVLWDGPEGERIRGENIVWITDRVPDSDISGKHADNVLYRYDTASGSCAKLMDILDMTGADVPAVRTDSADDPQARIFVFGSCRGGVGCTTVCRAVGQELTRFFGKRVMWMSMDGIEPGPGGGEESGGSRTGERVDRCLYDVLGRDENSPLPDMERFMQIDGYGLATFRPSMGRNPLPGLDPDEVGRLMAAIAGTGFDALLIDAGTCCSNSVAEIMSSADRICFVGKRGDAERKNRYMSWIKDSIDPGRSKGDKSGAWGRIVLAEDLPQEHGDMDILLEGEFGKNIHALTEVLWYNETEGIA